MAKKPRMTFDDVLEDMRSHGLKLGKELLLQCARQGVFPFIHVIANEVTGKIQYLILRKDYDDWARDYFYLEETA